jgi:hypothetical protein
MAGIANVVHVTAHRHSDKRRRAADPALMGEADFELRARRFR